MSNPCEYHLPVQSEGITAVEHLATASNLSRQTLKQAMQKGCVWLEKAKYTQRLRRAKKPLSKGDTLHFYYNPEVLAVEPPQATLVADEGDYSIWHKPAGMFSQGSKWGDHCTIYRWAEQHLSPERPAFVVHRLDRAASGLIILAHKKTIAAKFSALLQQHQIDKHYAVTVYGDFSIALQSEEKGLTIHQPVDNKPALSHITLLQVDAERQQSHLDVSIETGRKHQIRQHLSGLGFPVVGDRLYTTEKEFSDSDNLQLKAVSLQFECPVTGDKKFYKL